MRSFSLRSLFKYLARIGAKCSISFSSKANKRKGNRAIGNDWANFLAFYLLVSILSPGISVPPSLSRGDRFLSAKRGDTPSHAEIVSHWSHLRSHPSMRIALLPRDPDRDPSFDIALLFLLRSFVTNTSYAGEEMILLAGSQTGHRDSRIRAPRGFIKREREREKRENSLRLLQHFKRQSRLCIREQSRIEDRTSKTS